MTKVLEAHSSHMLGAPGRLEIGGEKHYWRIVPSITRRTTRMICEELIIDGVNAMLMAMIWLMMTMMMMRRRTPTPMMALFYYYEYEYWY